MITICQNKVKGDRKLLVPLIKRIHKSKPASFYGKQEFQIVPSKAVSMISNFLEVSLHVLKLQFLDHQEMFAISVPRSKYLST
jgi:hypothetical protein